MEGSDMKTHKSLGSLAALWGLALVMSVLCVTTAHSHARIYIWGPAGNCRTFIVARWKIPGCTSGRALSGIRACPFSFLRTESRQNLGCPCTGADCLDYYRINVSCTAGCQPAKDIVMS